MKEIWKDIEGYEGRYQISNLGNVKSLEHYHKCMFWGKERLRHRKEQLLKQWKRSNYLLVDLWKDNKRDVKSVHVLVYKAFIDNIEEGFIVHHIDENKINNNVNNLKLINFKEHNELHFNGSIPWNKGLKNSHIKTKENDYDIFIFYFDNGYINTMNFFNISGSKLCRIINKYKENNNNV